jgi:hypothetical protein
MASIQGTEADMMRASKLTPQQVQLLRDWGDRLRDMFRGEVPYHVGSSVDGDTWRDVDVRVILDNDTFGVLEEIVDIGRLDLALTVWGERATGLPIDCQVQSVHAAEAIPEDRPRNPAINLVGFAGSHPSMNPGRPVLVRNAPPTRDVRHVAKWGIGGRARRRWSR